MQSTPITIASGDTLSGLAATHGVSVKDIMGANPSITDPNKIAAGATLNIPKPTVIQTSTQQRQTTAQNQDLINGIIAKNPDPSTGGSNANIYDPATGKMGYQVPGAPLPTGWKALPTGETGNLPDKTNGVNNSGNNNNNNGGSNGGSNNGGMPEGATGFKYGADGTKQWTDASGNVIDTSSTPEQNGTITDPNSSAFKSQVDAITKAGQDQMTALNNTLQQSMQFASGQTAAIIAQLQQQLATQGPAIIDSYTRLGGARGEANARNGLDRYATDQANGVMTNIMNVEQEKLTNLATKINAEISKAQAAQQNGNMKAYNAAASNIQKIQDGMNKSVLNLQKAMNDYKNAQTKANNAAITAGTKAISTAKSISTSVAAEVADLSPEDKKKVIAQVAQQYNIDPEILTGFVDDASTKNSQTQQRLNNSTENANRTSNKNTGGGQSGNFKYSGQDISDITSSLQQGGNYNGTKYNGVGKDGYVDPGLYQELGTAWQQQGGKLADFVKNFPPSKYINPAANSTLPTYFRNTSRTPKDAGSGTTAP